MGMPYKYTWWKFITGQPDKTQNAPTVGQRLNRIQSKFFAKEQLMMPDDRYQSVSSHYVKQLEENRATLHWVFSEKKKKWWTDKRSGKQKENFYFETGNDFLAGIKLLNENLRPTLERAVHFMYDDAADSEARNIRPDQLQSEINQPLKMMAWVMGHHHEDYSLEVAKTYLLRLELNRLKLISKTKLLSAADINQQLQAEKPILQLSQPRITEVEETLEPIVMEQSELQPEEFAVTENEIPISKEVKLVLLTDKHPKEDFTAAKIVEMKPRPKTSKFKSALSKVAIGAAIIFTAGMAVTTAFLKNSQDKKPPVTNHVKNETVLVAKQAKHEAVKPTVKTKIATVAPKAKDNALAANTKPEAKKIIQKKKPARTYNRPSAETLANAETSIDTNQPVQDNRQQAPASDNSIDASKLKSAKPVLEINLPIIGLAKISLDTMVSKQVHTDTTQAQPKPTAASMDPFGGNGSGMKKLKTQSDTSHINSRPVTANDSLKSPATSKIQLPYQVSFSENAYNVVHVSKEKATAIAKAQVSSSKYAIDLTL